MASWPRRGPVRLTEDRVKANISSGRRESFSILISAMIEEWWRDQAVSRTHIVCATVIKHVTYATPSTTTIHCFVWLYCTKRETRQS